MTNAEKYFLEQMKDPEFKESFFQEKLKLDIEYQLNDLNIQFNKDYIIKLVEVQIPERQDLIIALRNCKDGFWSDNAYYRFVDSLDANQPGSEWQFDESFVLEQHDKGDIVIDFLKNGKVGGIEFTEFLLITSDIHNIG